MYSACTALSGIALSIEKQTCDGSGAAAIICHWCMVDIVWQMYLIFQTLVCTSAPLTDVLQLLPDPDGLHIALRCRKALSVMKLTRLRGLHGEFGGGQRTVNCKSGLCS